MLFLHEFPATTTVLADTTVLATISSDAIIADVPSIAIISHSNNGSRDFICHVLSLLGGVSKKVNVILTLGGGGGGGGGACSNKPLLKWSKPQLQSYLAEHNVNNTGN